MIDIENFYKNPDGSYDPIAKGSKIMFLDNSSMMIDVTEHDELTIGEIYIIEKVITRDGGEAQMCTIQGKGDKEYALYHFENIDNPMYGKLIVDESL